MATSNRDERSSSRPRAPAIPGAGPTSYPPTSPNPSPPRVPQPAYAHSSAAETDPLALDTSPNFGGEQHGFVSHDFAPRDRLQGYYGQQLHHQTQGNPGDEAYTAIALGEPTRFETLHGKAGSLDYSDGGDLSNSVPRTSLSTHNSRTQLRAAAAGGAYLPTGVEGDPEKHVDSRPVAPGPSVTLGPDTRQSARAERMYGSGEKGGASGASTPRSRSADRGGSRGGLGQWSGPAGANTPYGKLGESGGSNQPSGFNSAASSNPNLQFAEVSNAQMCLRERRRSSFGILKSADSCSTQGDFIPSNGNWFSRAFFAVLNSHYIVRWMCASSASLALHISVLTRLATQHLHRADSGHPLDSGHCAVHRQAGRLDLDGSPLVVERVAQRRLGRLVGCTARCVSND